MPAHPSIGTLLLNARQLAGQGDAAVAAAEAAYQQILAMSPGNTEAIAALGQLAVNRRDMPAAANYFSLAHHLDPANPQHGLDHAFALLSSDLLQDAVDVLQKTVTAQADCFNAWLMLGQVFDALNKPDDALRAFHQAVLRAQGSGQWLTQSSTPPAMLDAVIRAIKTVRQGHRWLYHDSYDNVRQAFGSTALKRVDKALAGYLKELQVLPDSPHQQPRFFYIPDLPTGPYHDPALHTWSAALAQAYQVIRAEALRTLAEDSHFENFIQFRDSVKVEDYLRGENATPTWEALFFYRRGKRYDANHTRCPDTSKVLDSLDLCHVENEAPEICFSVLTAGSEILPHCGVTNARLVMHLPLLVPESCALHVFGGGEHHWREGELVMFDDTFKHEAWNRSASTRVVLLMDCWNPHLDAAERQAVKQLLEAIGGMQRAAMR